MTRRRPYTLARALRRRGSDLMRKWQRLVDFFADGHVDIAEEIYPKLASYRKRAMRIARKLRNNPTLHHP